VFVASNLHVEISESRCTIDNIEIFFILFYFFFFGGGGRGYDEPVGENKLSEAHPKRTSDHNI